MIIRIIFSFWIRSVKFWLFSKVLMKFNIWSIIIKMISWFWLMKITYIWVVLKITIFISICKNPKNWSILIKVKNNCLILILRIFRLFEKIKKICYFWKVTNKTVIWFVRVLMILFCWKFLIKMGLFWIA